MAVSELIKNVMNELETLMQTKTVVGDPISAGDYTVIPVSKVSFGFGAGGGPTAVAVVSDLESIAAYGSNRRTQGRSIEIATVKEDLFAPHYVRFVVSDRPGIIEALAGIFSKYNVNIDSVLQEPGYSKEELPFVVTLETCQSRVVELALQECSVMDFNIRPPLSMPMLETGDRKE